MSRPFTISDILKSACGHLNQHLSSEQGKKVARAKYKNEKVYWNDMVFDSKKEYQRYRELLLLLKAGSIGQLRRQVKYLLIEAHAAPIIGKRGLPLKKTKTVEKKTEYWADHVYVNAETGEEIVEDVKSEATRKLSTYIIKRKLMLKIHGISIKEF